MLFGRQKALLALLDTHGGEVGNLDFQKILFLYCQSEESPTYEFVPYKFGGFSFTSYADRRRLTEQGLLADEERVWKLTAAGRAAALIPNATRKQMERFAKDHSHLRGNELVAEAYRRYPYHAIRSEVATRVLASDTVSLQAIEKARPAIKPAGLYTIGYEGKSLERYLNVLVMNGVSLLCDVRRNPLSRKYGFSKGTLSKGCEGVGINYEHLPELGIDSEQRRELHTQQDYDALFAVYRRESLPKQTNAVAKIQAWLRAGERVALTCFEHLPEQCHRHCVAESLQPTLGPECAVQHL